MKCHIHGYSASLTHVSSRYSVYFRKWEQQTRHQSNPVEGKSFVITGIMSAFIAVRGCTIQAIVGVRSLAKADEELERRSVLGEYKRVQLI